MPKYYDLKPELRYLYILVYWCKIYITQLELEFILSVLKPLVFNNFIPA